MPDESPPVVLPAAYLDGLMRRVEASENVSRQGFEATMTLVQRFDAHEVSEKPIRDAYLAYLQGLAVAQNEAAAEGVVAEQRAHTRATAIAAETAAQLEAKKASEASSELDRRKARNELVAQVLRWAALLLSMLLAGGGLTIGGMRYLAPAATPAPTAQDAPGVSDDP